MSWPLALGPSPPPRYSHHYPPPQPGSGFCSWMCPKEPELRDTRDTEIAPGEATRPAVGLPGHLGSGQSMEGPRIRELYERHSAGSVPSSPGCPDQRRPPPTLGGLSVLPVPGGVGVRGGAATSKEAHSEDSGRVDRRKESPDCWAAAARAGRLPSQCLQTWPRLLSAAVRFLSILLPFFLLPPSSSEKTPGQNPPQLNTTLSPGTPSRDQGQGK